MRIIILLDIDCFYVQCERLQNPELKNKPCAVVQYNLWKGGGIIAMSYEAKHAGITRGMRGEEAKKILPDIELITVPEARGKANLTKYREYSTKILDALKSFSPDETIEIERASIDEAYLDITNLVNAHMSHFKDSKNIGDVFTFDYINLLYKDTCFAPENTICDPSYLDNFMKQLSKNERYKAFLLLQGAILTKKLRDHVLNVSGFECSAGISYNKMLAKLACGINKPNKQTIVFESCVARLYEHIPLTKIRGLGGKLGESLKKRFKVEKMSDLKNINTNQLKLTIGSKTTAWLLDVLNGIDEEPVESRLIPKSIGCGKNFPGKRALVNNEKVTFWMTQLVTELLERLDKDQNENNRKPKTLHISLGQDVHTETNRVSHQFPFPPSESFKDTSQFTDICMRNIRKFNTAQDDKKWEPSVTNISLSATNFIDFGSDSTSPTRNKQKQTNLNAFQIKSTPKSKENSKEPKKLPKPSEHLSSPEPMKKSLEPKSEKTDHLYDWHRVDHDVLKSLPDHLRWQIENEMDFDKMKRQKSVATKHSPSHQKKKRKTSDSSPHNKGPVKRNLVSPKNTHNLRSNTNNIKKYF